MSVTRRALGLLLASTAALAGCSSSSAPEGGADATEPESEPPRAAAPEDGPGEGGQPTEPDAPDQEPDGGDGLTWDTAPTSLAALGDSITTGFDACDLLADCPEVSWATGTDATVSSVADQLGATDTWNEAEAGARMADLPEQAGRLAAHQPDLVTVLMGANDACAPTVDAMTEPTEFRADFTEALAVLREDVPDAQVFVASLPDLRQLWLEGRNEPAARTAWRFGICPALLGDPQDDSAEAEQRRAAVYTRVDEFNTVLDEVCAAEPACRYDGGAVHDHGFGAAELSPWDWFHPSREGQRELARIAHEEIVRE